MKRLGPRELIPQLFELECGLELSLCPQQRDHLSEHRNGGMKISSGDPSVPQDLAQAVGEPPRLRPSLERKQGERLGRIERHIAALPDRRGYIHAARTEIQCQREAVL